MRRARYRATPDRTGWALATGTLGVAVGAALVGWGSAASGPTIAAGAMAAGGVAAAVIVTIAAPLWWLGGRWTRRGPVAAGLIGAAVAALLALAALTRGFGWALPASDGATVTAIWTSALATAAVAGFLGGLAGLAMWLVAYRPG